MKSLSIKFLTALIFQLLSNSISVAAIQPGATVVQLRKDCGTLDNCFSTMPSLLDWIWGSGAPGESPRNPSASLPLTVNIGPGEYQPFICRNGPGSSVPKGFVSLIGSSRDATKIILRENIEGGPPIQVPVRLANCTNLSFSRLAVITTSANVNIGYAIYWTGTGTSTWSDVYVEASRSGDTNYNTPWYDSGVAGLHYWYNSKLVSIAHARGINVGYESQGSESWFYGSEIDVVIDNLTPVTRKVMYGLDTAVSQGDIRLFGSVIRVLVDDSQGLVDGDFTFYGIRSGTAQAHMHGGSISVDGSKATGTVTAIGISGNSHVHDTAITVKPGQGGGSAIRVEGDLAEAPFIWPPGKQLPAVKSTNGSDTFVETDCNSSGICDGVAIEDQQPHMMIYSENCTSRWFDSTVNACRP
ncbi:MAG TPA: hypothetical protein ENJ08_00890 [Gammaproteobacteria bacterium]|nr:hypothetical protein [Gammaproteobacteria bacterium]